MPNLDVTAFGESMLRLSVPTGYRLSKLRQLDVHAGGAETNGLAALRSLGRHCAWLSALPNSDIGQFVLRELSASSIDTSEVILNDNRIGTYYLEFAEAPRPINVIYDRADSAVSLLSPKDINWDYLLDAKVLHLTGITAALSEGCYNIILEACQRAKAKNISVSFDVNYRSKLWSAQTAKEKLEPILKLVDILICGEGDAETIFGFSGSAESILSELKALSDAQHVILTQSSQGSSTLINGEVIQVAAKAADIVDRLGAGDAFSAGVIDGFLDKDIVKGMQRGSVLSALALTQHGDMIVTSRQELESLLLSTENRLSR